MKSLGSMCLCFCILGLTLGLGQDAKSKWLPLPPISLEPNHPDLIGAMVGASAKRGVQESSARVVVSVYRKWGTARIDILIKDMSKMISEESLWPYTGPDPG